ncbi:hypothetical protein EV13_3096 [Prochlorococcus sp. MIT 0702]|nr:hypothetical protein EV12_3087 [Prochlorococcus sp. MIT 0701]KGG25517.1 hypothetical protein EV13_3096 [Prochlorococcus sp. MIT 0702]KGG30289.1 hypothetical protein EV14_3051 [Prochlorococcus sp. MIT 0703]
MWKGVWVLLLSPNSSNLSHGSKEDDWPKASLLNEKLLIDV